MAGPPEGCGALAGTIFLVILSPIMCCLSPVLLVRSVCLCAPWVSLPPGGVRVSPATPPASGVSRGAPWGSESRDDLLLGCLMWKG